MNAAISSAPHIQPRSRSDETTPDTSSSRNPRSESSQLTSPSARLHPTCARVVVCDSARMTSASSTASMTGYDAQTNRTDADTLESAAMDRIERFHRMSTHTVTTVRASTTASRSTRSVPRVP
jgi:hypothetical protein